MIKNIRLNKKVLATLMLSSSLVFCGCESYEYECDINTRHAHLYTYDINDDLSLQKYIESEMYMVNGYKKEADYIEITDDDALKLDAISDYESFNKNDVGSILKINENEDYIKYLKNEYQNYYDYKCEDKSFYARGTYPLNPFNRYIPTVETEIYYSKDPDNKHTTGEKRLHYYTFYGYNIVKIDGHYELVESDNYFTLDDCLENCEYIAKNCISLQKTEDEELINYITEKNPKVKLRK